MQELLLYVGTYTSGASKGIYSFRFCGGRLTPVGLVAETVNPSFLALSPNKRFLYAVGEVKEYKGQPSGFARTYLRTPGSSALKILGETSSKGAGPCFIAPDKTGEFIAVANYVGGSIAVFKVQSDGSMGEPTSFVQHSAGNADGKPTLRPHPHGVFFSNNNRFAIVPDLGLDKLFLYKFDAGTGVLSPADVPYVSLPHGSGPRHFAFHLTGKYAYVLNELGSTITAFKYESHCGELQEFQRVSTLPNNFRGATSTAEIEIDRDGKFLYASNRGSDSIAVFAIASDGTLTSVEHVPTQGKTPRHFAIDPSGDWLIVANQDTNNIVVFSRNRTTGELMAIGREETVPAPACLVFAPAY